MPIEFQCPSCQSRLRVPDDSAGKLVRCPKCGHLDRIPSDQAPAALEDTAAKHGEGLSADSTARKFDQSPPPGSPDHGNSHSLEAERKTSVPRGDGNRTSGSTESNPYSAPVAEGRPPHVQYRMQPTYESTKQQLYIVGIMMIVMSLLELALPVFGLIAFVQSLVTIGFREDDTIGLIFCLLFGIMGVLTLLGGVEMIRRKRYWMAMAGSLTAILSGLFCCFLPSVFGVWSLVLLLSTDSGHLFQNR